MGGAPRVNGQGLGITHIGQVRDQLEAIDDLAARSTAALDTNAQDTTETALEVLLGLLVRGVALQTGVRHPRDIGALLEVLSQREGVLGVSLGAQAEGLETEDELLGGERVEGSSEITEDLDAGADYEGDGAEGLPELEAVVAI